MTFQFHGFTPDNTIRTKANRLLAQFREHAPSGANLSGTLEWDGQQYLCTLNLHSKVYPLAVTRGHGNAAIALDKAELALGRKLEQRGIRFSTRPRLRLHRDQALRRELEEATWN